MPLQQQRLLIIASYPDINIPFEISNEIKIDRPATDLTIFDVGLAYIGLIDQDLEILAAVRAFDIFLEQLQFLLLHTELHIPKRNARIPQ